MKRKISIAFVMVFMLMVACAHAPTQAQKALQTAQKVDAIARDVMVSAPQFIKAITNKHLYNQAVKAYNDTLKIVKDYDELVATAEKAGVAPKLDTMNDVIHAVLDLISNLESMGVPVDKLKAKALAFYGGKK